MLFPARPFLGMIYSNTLLRSRIHAKGRRSKSDDGSLNEWQEENEL